MTEVATVTDQRFKLAVFSETNKRIVFEMVLEKIIELHKEYICSAS